MAAAGAGITHHASCNLHVRNGIAPVWHMMQAGVRVAMGLDDKSLNDDDDPFQELRLASVLHRVPGFDLAESKVIRATDWLKTATVNAAIALGHAGHLGTLAPGQRADLVVLDTQEMLNDPWTTPDLPVPDLILSRAKGTQVRDAIVGGRVVLRDRRITTIDEDALNREVRDYVHRHRAAPPDPVKRRTHARAAPARPRLASRNPVPPGREGAVLHAQRTHLMHRRTLLAAIAALAARTAHADPVADLRTRGVLRIATTGANKPYTFATADGTLQGYDIDWARAIAAGLGVKPEFIRLDWKGILPGLIAHQFDCALSAVRITPDRAEAFDFSAPYGIDDVTVAVPASDTAVKGIEDLAGKTVATAAGSVQDQYARDHADAGKLLRLPGLPEVMLSVQANQAEAAVVGRGGAAAFIAETHAPLRLVGSYAGGDLAAVFPKHSPELVAAVNAVIAARRADGTYDAIFKRWFGAA